MRQQAWMHSLALPMGVLGWALGVYWLLHGVSAWWLLATVAGHMLVSISTSVGYHRFWTHRALRLPRAWQYVLGPIGAMSWVGSPLDWNMVHGTHHRHADRPGDPHYVGWRYMFWKGRRNVPLYRWNSRWLMRDPLVMFLHNNFALVVLVLMGMLLAVHPLLLVFGYLMPLALLTFASGLHQFTTHARGRVHNYPWLEYVMPLCGEWMHAYHHQHPRRWDYRYRWWHLDIGALFIKYIARAA